MSVLKNSEAEGKLGRQGEGYCTRHEVRNRERITETLREKEGEMQLRKAEIMPQ